MFHGAFVSRDIILHPPSAPQPVSGVQIYLYQVCRYTWITLLPDKRNLPLSSLWVASVSSFVHVLLQSLFLLLPSLCSVHLVPLPCSFQGPTSLSCCVWSPQAQGSHEAQASSLGSLCGPDGLGDAPALGPKAHARAPTHTLQHPIPSVRFWEGPNILTPHS